MVWQSPLLALVFTNPWLLAGLALAAIPLIIHLLSRRRFQETRWAAMQFLQAALRQRQRRLRMDRWLLLALRTAGLALAALALSDPVWQAGPTLGFEQPPRLRILVVDTTMSVQEELNSRTMFRQMLDRAERLLDESKAGDGWHLVRLSARPPHVVIRQTAFDPAEVRYELQQLAPLDERGDAASVLEEVRRLCESDERFPLKEVHLLTDWQGQTWQPADEGAATRVRSLLQTLGKEARVFGDLPETQASGNVSIADLRVSPTMILANQPLSVVASIRTSGPESPGPRKVELYVDGRLNDVRTVPLAANQETLVEFRTSLPAGDRQIEIRCGEDALPADNFRRVVIPVRNGLEILLVNGRQSQEPMGRATDFVELALNPDPALPRNRATFRTTTIPEADFLRTDLAPYDVVFLCDLARLTERELSVLRRYVAQGGGVVIAPGDRASPADLQASLTGGGQPLFPVQIAERAGNPDQPEQFYQFDLGTGDHPIIALFRGNPNTGFETTRTFAYLRMEPLPGQGIQTALKFSTGDPAILTRSLGRGRIVLVTTTLDRDWGTWPVWGHSFVPLMHETVRFAAGERWAPRQGLPGTVWRLPVLGTQKQPPTLTGPSGQTIDVLHDEGDEGTDWISVPLETSGFYRLSHASADLPESGFAINPDPIESDLTRLPQTVVSSLLNAGERSEPATATFATAQAVEPRGHPGMRLCLWLVLAVLLVEPLFAWNSSRGLSLAAGLVALTLLGSWIGPSWAFLVLVVAAGGLWLLKDGLPLGQSPRQS